MLETTKKEEIAFIVLTASQSKLVAKVVKQIKYSKVLSSSFHTSRSKVLTGCYIESGLFRIQDYAYAVSTTRFYIFQLAVKTIGLYQYYLYR